METQLDKLVDNIANDFIKKAVHPNYLKIRRILIQDNITGNRDFIDRYGVDGTKKFIKIYKRLK